MEVLKDYYTIRQATEILPYKIRTIRQWISDKKIKAVKFYNSNLWLIPKEEIERKLNDLSKR